MKKILLLLFFLVNLNAISQNEFKKLPKGSCSIDHNCKAEYFKDDFQEIEKYRIPIFNSSLGKSSVNEKLLFSLQKHVLSDKSIKTHIYLYGNIKACRDENSYVHFIFKDGSESKIITSNSNIECGTAFIPLQIDNELLNKLQNNEIEKIRLQFIDGKEDFSVNSKDQRNLYEKLKCIIAIEKKTS
ncbi:hypothetical protein MG290_14785 (plasmid) [Flavobacterium sp. CBA20B-1]|uniref:hypothetical protein n=1 Tax=unclassified Flavobacterium TaxID=196869 RepID=UPI0022242A7F|nr:MULTISPECIES: hypothetical protein [unclassified Flavobacterium]WCM43609.1 hypothetical protein MG290_14785 [Flavobacterium sp. CBA20B-1]